MSKTLIIVERFPYEPDWTLSEFYIDGIKRGVGVEDEHRDQKVRGETRIDNGIYPLEFRHSPKFSKKFFCDDAGYLSERQDKRFKDAHQLIWIKDTPRHDLCLIHWGNTDDDTEGCYVVGSSFATFNKQKGVSASKIKYLEIYPIIFQHMKRLTALGEVPMIEFRDKPKQHFFA